MRRRKGNARVEKSPHREWLSLVEVSGPFLSLEVLTDEFPQGLDTHDPVVSRGLRSAYEEWQSQRHDEAYHRAWLEFIMEEVLGFLGPARENWREGPAIPPGCTAHLAQHGETLVPDRVLVDGDTVRWLVQWLPPGQKLDKPIPGKAWVADPVWRMVELLHATGKKLGLVSNGEHFALVSAPLGEPSGVASFYAELWLEEPLTLRAFRTLLGAHRFLNVPEESGPEGLLERSAQEQHQVTTALGQQVLQAVELLVGELDRLDRSQNGKLLEGVSEQNLFRGALTVMMRLIFLLSAEERNLLPLNNSLYLESYAVSPLAQMLREVGDRQGEELLSRREDAWARLLATFRAVFAGVQHEDLHLPAYGGSLFDPDRFPFLEGRTAGTRWTDTPAVPLALHNQLVLYLLESLQTLKQGKEVLQRVSFRALDVEQLGHVYESLLDHTVKRSSSAILGLRGKAGQEPEIELSLLLDSPDEALTALASATGRKATDLRKEIVYDTPPENPILRDRCEDDRLYHCVLPFQKLLRDDAMGRSVFFPPGGAYVTQSSERRESGAHYTPRSLTDEMVQHALDPLVYPGISEGLPPAPERLLRPEELLSLKVLDMAMGSGAFLVQCCRYLAEHLVESWSRYGAPADLPAEPEARLAVARRLVAESCLFGVDRDPLAVEMAKLSLWLLTLDQQKPFSFVDHALRCGDSLLGLTQLEQLRQLTLQPASGQVTRKLSQEQVEEAINRARQARLKLESFVVVDPRDAEQKAILLKEAEQAVEELRRLADLVIAAGLQVVGNKGFDLRLEEMRAVPNPPLAHWLNSEKPESAPPREPFHWILEFPEVFERGGFDAVVGNPPFYHGQKLTGSLGADYRELLVRYLAAGQRGSADLVAYFFLRARELLRFTGTLGFVATNTLAQGDTREVGLDQLTGSDMTLYQASPGRKWPGGAAVEIVQVWARRGAWQGAFRLGGQSVRGITPSLTARSRVNGKPYRLLANEGQSFQGSIILGLGFVLTPEEAQQLLDKDSRNADVLFPYLNGEDVNTRVDQSPSRWVINFHNWPLELAKEYPDCFQIVLDKVKPERMQKKGPCSKYWWRYERARPELYRKLDGLDRVIAVPIVSKHCIFVWQETGVVFSNLLTVITDGSPAAFTVLQSTFHEEWSRSHGSTLETRMRYTPTDCYETFPRPIAPSENLEKTGELYHQLRSSVAFSRSEGLTRILNKVHDSGDLSRDILDLRDLHRTLDQQVALSYGWSDLDLGHGFHETAQGVRYTIAPAVRVEVLDRLLELNFERHELEAKQLPQELKQPNSKVTPLPPKKSQLSLFTSPEAEDRARELAAQTIYLAADASVPASELGPELTEGYKKLEEEGDQVDKLR